MIRKAIFSLMFFCLSVNVPMQLFAAAAAPKKPDIAMAPAGRPLTASEQAGQLRVLVIQKQRVPVATIQSFFNAMRSENQAGQLSVLQADTLIATTAAELRKLEGGGTVANSLNANYDVIRRQLRQ